jgi:RNA polymerase sigma-70 factor (ECF subfamily)
VYAFEITHPDSPQHSRFPKAASSSLKFFSSLYTKLKLLRFIHRKEKEMNHDAFNQALKEKSTLIFRYLLKNGATKSDAEDIVQDTLYKALLSIDAIQPEKFASWLFRVAVNQYYDLCRKRKRRPELPMHSVVLISQGALEDELLRKETRKEIYETLGKLNPTYKHVLLLKYDFNLSYKEIAALLDVKEDTVKTWLHRARNQFKKAYERMNQNEREGT